MSCTDTGNLTDVIDVTLTTATFNFYIVNTTLIPLNVSVQTNVINPADPTGFPLTYNEVFSLAAAEGISRAYTFTGLTPNTTYTIQDCFYTTDDPNCQDQYTITNPGSFTTLAPPPPPPPSGTAPLILFIELIVFIYALLQILV
jgi:hypothetical protein